MVYAGLRTARRFRQPLGEAGIPCRECFVAAESSLPGSAVFLFVHDVDTFKDNSSVILCCVLQSGFD